MKPNAILHKPEPATIAQLRKNAGLSQAALGLRLGISRRQVQYYEAQVGGAVRADEAPYLYQYALESLTDGTPLEDQPDVAKHNPKATYLRGLRRAAGLSQVETAKLLKVSRRTIQYYEADADQTKHIAALYLYQYALEQLVKA